MGHLFNLWNFFQSEDDICEFDVTRANMPRIKDISDKWLKEALYAFGVLASVQHWEVQAIRSYYFSSYPNEENWQDRWTEGWTIKVKLQSPLKPLVHRFDMLPRHLDISDETWKYGWKDPHHDTTALLISNHEGSLQQVELISQQIMKEVNSRNLLIEPPQVSLRTYGTHQQQLRITFPAFSFPDKVDMLEQLLEYCRQRGGMVNWRPTG